MEHKICMDSEVAVLAEGDAKNRDDIKFLAPLPTFKADGSVR